MTKMGETLLLFQDVDIKAVAVFPMFCIQIQTCHQTEVKGQVHP